MALLNVVIGKEDKLDLQAHLAARGYQQCRERNVEAVNKVSIYEQFLTMYRREFDPANARTVTLVFDLCRYREASVCPVVPL